MASLDKNPPLRLYVIPVSGGFLASQFALLKELHSARRKIDRDPSNVYPHIVLPSSGGNVCAYVSMAGGWSSNGIDRVAAMLDPKMLTLSWWPDHLDFLPTSLIGIFTGSLYRPGYGVTSFFKSLFTKKTISQTEIWTGTFNKTKRKAQFFCNKKEGETYISAERFEQDRSLYNCEPLTYTNGNVELIAKISAASASVPVIVEELEIFDSQYVDGGVVYASPLSALSTEIYRIVTGDYKDMSLDVKVFDIEQEVSVCRGNISGDGDDEKSGYSIDILTAPKKQQHRLQLTYFSCVDTNLASLTRQSYEGVTKEVNFSFDTMNNSLSIIDRAKSIELLTSIARGKEVKHEHHQNLDTNSLAILLERILNYEHYVLNLYPHGSRQINMISFTGEKLVSLIREIQNSYGCHLYYVE